MTFGVSGALTGFIGERYPRERKSEDHYQSIKGRMGLEWDYHE